MRYLTYLFPFILLFFTACGGGNSNNQQQEQLESSTQSQASNSSSDDIRTIDIIGIDKMKFVVEEQGEMIGTGDAIETTTGESYVLLESIDAQPGEEIRIRLTTVSQLPAQAMSHNYVQLQQNTDVQAFVDAAIQAQANDYIPSDMNDQIIAETGLAGDGETVEVTFTVPEESGSYPFICSFPAHYTAGMKGMLNVQ